MGINIIAQQTIKCYAPSFKGQIASLVTFEDYISYEYRILDRGIVDENGYITFEADPKKGMKAIIQIQDKSGAIYLDPKTPEYNVSFPLEVENVQKLNGNTVRLVFDNLPKNDLNTLILEFNLRFDYFLYGDTARVMLTASQSKVFQDSLANFTSRTFDIYKDIDNPYFKNYFKYSIASIALYSNRQDPAKNKYIIFETFIKGNPILYHNDAYMSFIKDFYRDALSDVILFDRDKIMFAINKLSSREALDEAMASHYYLKNDVFREFIMVNALMEGYHTTFFERRNMQEILWKIVEDPVSEKHADIAKNVLDFQNKLLIGSDAPQLSWTERNGETVNLRSLRGKHVYLQFWASWNKPSIQEMLIMKKLKEKYGKYVTFVSISLDANPEDYEQFMKNNTQGMDWHFGHYNGDSKILDDYNLRNVPIYFFIDDKGRLKQSPALSPSPNGTYKSIDESFFYLKKKLEPKAEFQIGGRN
ncbi:Thiol-disulfide oxidoreductase ResA [Parvicella tangerina]|uniref:Thiol-disulfide oxidoreductase ResA n=2 Tax=Parvicella tangerina TaxID=2829795 RepID=A0A916JQ07_9FLAO|nr:Thiol-disulfide oxidoreductase ResA [Parvicella tangerina]